jgi:hypothetical protein
LALKAVNEPLGDLGAGHFPVFLVATGSPRGCKSALFGYRQQVSAASIKTSIL